MNLSLIETRVIGCLMEKEKTTPDQYPLSLNALTNACNQKSSRDPVLDLSEEEVLNTVDDLKKKRLVMEQAGFGSRVVKVKHRFCNSEFGELQLSDQEYAVICVLFLRGPQTPGELRSRTNRLCEFSDVNEVESVLQALATWQSNPLVKCLPREPGQRDSRYAHLFSGDIEVATSVYESKSPAPIQEQPSLKEDRIDALEQRVEQLRVELDDLKSKLQDLL